MVEKETVYYSSLSSTKQICCIICAKDRIGRYGVQTGLTYASQPISKIWMMNFDYPSLEISDQAQHISISSHSS